MLADCASREDVSYVIREMISELNVGHAYYSGGDVGDEPHANARPARLRLRARRRRLEDRASPRRRGLGHRRARPALAAGRGRQGRRLPARGQRRAARSRSRIPGPASRTWPDKTVTLTVSTKPTLDADRARRRRQAARQRARPALPRLDRGATASTSRTRPAARSATSTCPSTGIDGQNDLVRQLLRPDAQGSADHRRALEQRRPDPDALHRAPESPRHELLGAPRRQGLDLAAGFAPGPEVHADQRPLRLGRRRVPLLLQAGRGSAS